MVEYFKNKDKQNQKAHKIPEIHNQKCFSDSSTTHELFSHLYAIPGNKETLRVPGYYSAADAGLPVWRCQG